MDKIQVLDDLRESIDIATVSVTALQIQLDW
jgi:hypothetical protein